MDVDSQGNSPQPYTILRIKRKRNEEPLEALGKFSFSTGDWYDPDAFLVVESRIRKKKSKGGLDVFQFAETVEPNAWQDERQTKDLQACRVLAA